ncbi:pyridoxamine 5'-phosphate oxidase [Gordonia sp. TBRC 11910]|uniref:Pyridoxamine 5'-phosphate oxidase n=1 Tax=Gordonia asplenii TaxID=2725283 RepID=A0A848KZG5_9ACTN|nr:pyridoxamine 5'-phosphate oxidase family protein [Gordonia asplenii]NMO03547.1 pyridoxamine 5'-phosphate oxidase [Gordonia asplenii]
MGPFHDGECLVQQRAGVVDDAARYAGMLRRDAFTSAMAGFVADRRTVFITARDSTGTLWTSPISGAPGFCDAAGSALRIREVGRVGDPLHGVARGQRAGFLLIDFAKRRRLRVNGMLVGADDGGLEVAVEQVYGNCPKYINPHVHEAPVGPAGLTSASSSLGAAAREVVARANTFILGTTHPTCGPDTSHRGGSPGFVGIDGNELWWPDYAGNNLFNSLGNLVVDPEASMLIVDDAATVQISGTARIEWSCPQLRDDEPGTGKCVRLDVASVVETTAIS